MKFIYFEESWNEDEKKQTRTDNTVSTRVERSTKNANTGKEQNKVQT